MSRGFAFRSNSCWDDCRDVASGSGYGVIVLGTLFSLHNTLTLNKSCVNFADFSALRRVGRILCVCVCGGRGGGSQP